MFVRASVTPIKSHAVADATPQQMKTPDNANNDGPPVEGHSLPEPQRSPPPRPPRASQTAMHDLNGTASKPHQSGAAPATVKPEGADSASIKHQTPAAGVSKAPIPPSQKNSSKQDPTVITGKTVDPAPPSGEMLAEPDLVVPSAAQSQEVSAASEQQDDRSIASAPSSRAPSVDGSVADGDPSAGPTASGSVGGFAAAVAAADKIARLSRLVQGLKAKLERLQGENVQLEEMLAAADAAHRGGSGEIARLENALAKEQAARIAAETSAAAAIIAKDAEIESLREQAEAAAARATSLADALTARDAQMAAASSERSASEAQLIVSLRKEVEAAEAMLEDERKAHAAARRASAAREQELDSSMAEAATSLAGMQRLIEERTARATAAEERCLSLEAEVESLTRRVAEATTRADQLQATIVETNSATGGSSAASQRIEELEAALAEARAGRIDADAAAASNGEEAVRLRSELESMRRQLAEARSSDSVDLRRRLQEVTDALYAKQAQLERAAADRAAAQLLLERQQSSAAAEGLKRRSGFAGDRLNYMFGGAEDGGVVPMATLGPTYARLANAPGQLGKAVQAGAHFLDSTASQAVRVLRHYPLGRLAVFCYIIGMHLFIYLLLHRLQHRVFAASTSNGSVHSDILDDAVHG